MCRLINFFTFYIVFLLLVYTQISYAGTDCTDVQCDPPINCIEEALEEDSCCPSCVQFGCTCEGYQYYDCVNVGFKDGKVPEGESYFVDFGSTECVCPPGGGKISCHFIPCPELPPNCIDTLQPADGCIQCGRIGCIRGGEKYEAGHTFHMSHCKFCHCPSIGGELMCYDVPNCDTDLDNTTPPVGTPDGDAERQYDDYLYSQESDALESAIPVVAEKNNNYKRNAMQDRSVADYDIIDNSLSTKVYPTTSPHKMLPSLPQERFNSSSVVNSSKVERTTTEISTTTSNYKTHFVEEITPQHQGALEPHNGTNKILNDSFIFSTISSPTTSTNIEQMGLHSPFTTSGYTVSSPDREVLAAEIRDFTPINSTPASSPSTPHQKEDSRPLIKEPNMVHPHYLEERHRVFPDLNVSRLLHGATKDIIETCCATGQQWSIDHGECENMPLSTSEDCRYCCCKHYVKLYSYEHCLDILCNAFLVILHILSHFEKSVDFIPFTVPCC
ncbi:hypothetical protein GDO86_007269 [Hymenochirus boettgeri]|uniref:Fibulin-2 domain-containing protein n=1 Tax=Hymenochirus boettgeri TaxID=247094 RepID=A0A8T2IX19_9PIPI|nr:hypothetical protein GDO86_007269 [Hymenochirus boettgeri]